MKNGDVYTFTTFIRFFFEKKIKKILRDLIFIESDLVCLINTGK